MQKTVFVVDDSTTNLAMAEKALEKQYRVITLSSAAKMFAILGKVVPDLFLLDIEMPEMSGFEAIKRLKSNDSYVDIPVIFLTGRNESADEAYGIELGAVDFIIKPFSEPVLLNRIKNHLHIDELIRNRTALLRERTEQLVKLQNGIVYILADIVENRDENTGGHIERTSVYLKILIDSMMARGLYTDEMRSWDLDSVVSSARLHDVGKINIPDSILNKAGPLTEDEYKLMKLHASAGEKIIDKMVDTAGVAEFLKNAKLTAAYHHERWDGSGYPYGYKGTRIPLHGRLMAIVDAYDALTSERPYKKAFSTEDALQIIVEGGGNHFDPDIVSVFREITEQLEMARDKLINQKANQANK